MDKEMFISELNNLRVYDAHTHLQWDRLRASDFWEIVHYFWFLRELRGAGYPEGYAELPEAGRVDAFVAAFAKTAGTGMNHAVRRIFADLYGVEIGNARSVYAAIEKVRASSADPSWAAKVAAAGKMEHAVTNGERGDDFEGLPAVSVWVPRIDGRLNNAALSIHEAAAGLKAGVAEKAKAELLGHLGEWRASGARAFMTSLRALGKKTWENPGDAFADVDDCYIYLLRSLCAFAADTGMNVQLLTGMEGGYCKVAVPVNDERRIVNLYGLFEEYPCNFDLVVATEANNIDAVNAAHVFTNVYAGGMWWFNFRPGIFTDAMEKRFDVLPSCKSYLSISDSRCIEWAYGKIALIKKIAGNFLARKVGEGYADYPDALEIAKDWLYGSARMLYGKGGSK